MSTSPNSTGEHPPLTGKGCGLAANGVGGEVVARAKSAQPRHRLSGPFILALGSLQFELRYEGGWSRHSGANRSVKGQKRRCPSRRNQRPLATRPGSRCQSVSPRFGVIGQQLHTADESFGFIRGTFTRHRASCKVNSSKSLTLPPSRQSSHSRQPRPRSGRYQPYPLPPQMAGRALTKLPSLEDYEQLAAAKVESAA